MKVLVVTLPFASHGQYGLHIVSALGTLGVMAREVYPGDVTPRLIESFAPDLLLAFHGRWLPLETVGMVHRCGVRTALWSVEEPYELDWFLDHPVRETYDLVYTNDLASAEFLGVRYLPWCCSPQFHFPAPAPARYEADVCLVGRAFQSRVEGLNGAAEALAALHCRLVGTGTYHPLNRDRIPLDARLQRSCVPEVLDAAEVAQYYRGAKVSLNIHRDPIREAFTNRHGVPGVSPNDRTFAIAGCGGFQLVDDTRREIKRMFCVGKEVVTYLNGADLGEKVYYYLTHEDERQAIAQAGCARAHREHTYQHRLQRILEDVGLRTRLPEE